eukprot:5337595-Ditylum_brightwellii.AAC.1
MMWSSSLSTDVFGDQNSVLLVLPRDEHTGRSHIPIKQRNSPTLNGELRLLLVNFTMTTSRNLLWKKENSCTIWTTSLFSDLS